MDSEDRTRHGACPQETDRYFPMFVIGFYAAWLLRVVLLMPVDRQMPSEWMRQCWSQGLRILVWIVPVFLYLKFHDRVRPASFLRLHVLPRGRQLWQGLGITCGFLVLCIIGALCFQGGGLSNVARMTGTRWGALLCGMTFVALAEEILFRGFIYWKLRGTRSFLRANLLTSGLFLLIHWPGWLYMQGFHQGLIPLSLTILLVGFILGWLVETTRSLWPPILLHLANNVLSGILLP